MKIFLIGINGKMGRAICDAAEQSGVTVAGGIDVSGEGRYKVFRSAAEVDVDFDCIIDFSRPAALGDVIALARRTKKPAVIATTGYTDEQLAEIKALSSEVPVFRSANMSVGVNVVESVLPMLAKALKGFDVEIVEAHHNRKVDAPSGTALQMLAAVESGLDYDPRIVYGRQGESKREKGDIGVHAVRGGTIVGEHTVIFAGEDEIIEIKHTALSRRIFAVGSLRAASFLICKAPGMYDMADCLAEGK